MLKKSLFRINVNELPEQGLNYESSIPEWWLNEVLSETAIEIDGGRPRLNLRIEQTGSGKYFVRGTAETDVRTRCVCCLEDFCLHLTSPVEIYLSKESVDLPGHGDSDEKAVDDLQYEVFQDDYIVLDGLVRDSILLALPMNPKCRSDCEGWRAMLPDDSVTQSDPRLLPLKHIRLTKED